MTQGKKYRILSLEAEKLVHAQMSGGFFARVDGKYNEKLFSGMLDYSLESERIYDVCQKSRAMSRKTYFSQNGYDYTTAIINVRFRYKRHNYVSINGVYVREGFAVSEDFIDSAQVGYDDEGEAILTAIKVYQPLVGEPLSEDLLGDYFTYDKEKNWYVRRTDEHGKEIRFDDCENKLSLRERLYRDGFDCDGVHYVRYKRSAGSSRTGQCLFIAEPLYKKMMEWSLCGLDLKNRDSIDLASFEAYVSLSLSSITDTLHIPTSSILFMKDAKSVFNTRAVSVELNGEGQLESVTKDVEISNAIWDGEALLDTSVFKEAGYSDRGMMLLRNRFFKTCAFNTNLQKYFADNSITSVSELCGYTTAKDISDIKMIVTESSLKYLKLSSKKSFEEKIDAWIENVDDVFGIVKTDKPTGFFKGEIVRTSYQLLNTLGLSREETDTLLKDTFDYYKSIKALPIYMRNYINYTLGEEDEPEGDDEMGFFNARQKAVMNCLSRNDSFADTLIYKQFRSNVLSSFSRKIRSGKLLIKGTNATIFGNGLELLAASIGRFVEGDPAIALGGEGRIYCKHFTDGASVLGCRSPHVTMGNLMAAENIRVPEIDEYFNLTGEIVYVNAIECNIQQRLNGCDYDSDAMLLTDDPLLVAAAKRNASFAVPVCSVASVRKEYSDSPEGKAKLDHEISQNKIGDIINCSQLLNTLYWHNTVTSPMENCNEKLYMDICILAVLSGMEIDKAKRNYDVATVSILMELKSKYEIEQLPEFYKFIMYTLEKRRKFNGETSSYETTMDYVTSASKSFVRHLAKDKEEKYPLSHFLGILESDGQEIKSGKNDARDSECIKNYVLCCKNKIDELRHGIKSLDSDEKYHRMTEIEDVYRDVIDYVTKKLKNLYMLKYLLEDIEHGMLLNEAEDDNEECCDDEDASGGMDKKFYWILFESLCLEKKHLFYNILSNTRKDDMFDLIPNEDGEIEIYGVKHEKKLAKSAKK